MPRAVGWKPRLIYPTICTSITLARISALAERLFWRLLVTVDDQGRMVGDPEIIKATACPVLKDISEEDIPGLLKDLERELIIRYSTSSVPMLQIRQWWEYQCPQWAYPSKSRGPEGWVDHLRYRKGNKVLTQNWPPAPTAVPKGGAF